MWQAHSDQQNRLSPWRLDQDGIPLEEPVSPIAPALSPGISASHTYVGESKTPEVLSSVHPALANGDRRFSHGESDYDTYLQGYGHGFESVSTAQDRDLDRDQDPFFAPPQRHRHPYRRIWGSRDDGISTTGTAKSTTPSRSLAPRSRWWWWEIGAAFVSIASMTLILAVLGKADGTPLSSWPLPIQPNSLVAVLTTVGKSAMMVVVASCISQLKWRHFQHGGPRPLADLQLFEDASRGPWGAAVFLCGSFRVGAATAGAFALITVVALGIEPTVQQIFEFPSRLARMDNVTAEVGRAVVYESKAYAASHGHALDVGMFNQETLLLQSKIIDGVLGSVAEPSYSCPAASCSWPEFSSLGMCSSFRNLTDLAEPDCTAGTTNGTTDPYNLECTFDYTGRNESEVLVTMRWRMYRPPDDDLIPLYYSFFQSEMTNLTDAIGGISGSMTAVRVTDPDKFEASHGPPVEMLQARWFLCEHTFHNLTVEAGQLSAGNVTSETLVPVRNITLTSTSTSTSTSATTSGSSTPRPEDVLLTYRSPATGQEYALPQLVPSRIVAYLGTLLTNPFAASVNLSTGSGSYTGSLLPGSNDLFPMGYFMNSTDLAALAGNVAATLSGQMRSLGDSGGGGGDNANVTAHAGLAFAPETFIRVRWAWVVLPLAETVLGAVFLAATVVLSRDTPLFKGSVLAFLADGLRGGGGPAGIHRRDTAAGLGRGSRGLMARFVPDRDGWFEFRREGRG